jgi:MFS family permease
MAGFSGYILDSLFGILVGRAFLGLAVAGVMSGFTTLIGDYFEGDELNRFMGIQASVVAFGAVVFVLAGGFLADVGWRYPFLIYLLAFAVLPGVLFAIDEPVIQRRPQNQDNLNQNIDFPLRTVLFIYAITLVGMVVLFIVPVQLPFYLTKLTGASNSLVGVTLALQTLVAAVVSLQYQRIKKRLSFITITGLFFLTLGVGYIIVALAQGYAAIITGLLISGLGLGLYIPNSNVWLVSVVPAALRGRAVGGLTTALFLGQFRLAWRLCRGWHRHAIVRSHCSGSESKQLEFSRCFLQGRGIAVIWPPAALSLNNPILIADYWRTSDRTILLTEHWLFQSPSPAN